MGFSQRVAVGFGIPLPKHRKFMRSSVQKVNTSREDNHVIKNIKLLSFPINDGLVLFNKVVSIQTSGCLINNNIIGPIKSLHDYDVSSYDLISNKEPIDPLFTFLKEYGIESEDNTYIHLGLNKIKPLSYGYTKELYQNWLYENMKPGLKIKDIVGYYLITY